MSIKANLSTINDLAIDRCVTRGAMLSQGLSEDEIDSLRDLGFLADAFPGTYVVGKPWLSQREFFRASALHSGPGSFASGWTGLELRKVLPERLGRATMTTVRRNVKTPVRTELKLQGSGYGWLDIIQSTPSLVVPLETIDGFQTSLLPRTLIDTAGAHGSAVLRRAWREAEFLCILDADAIATELAKGSRRPGTPAVRKRLHDAYPVTRPGMDIRSRAGERLFLQIVREAGLPEPQVNVWILVGGKRYLADFYWAKLGFVVEVDGPLHDLHENSEEDKVRDVDLFNHGIDVLRFTTERLRTERQWCVESLAAAYSRQLLRAA